MTYNRRSLLEWYKSVVYVEPPASERYLRGLASYGKKVRTDKRKARILAELKAMGVKPRVHRKMGKRHITMAHYFRTAQDPKRSQAPKYVGLFKRRVA